MVEKLQNRINAVTGLDLDSADDLQVLCNYPVSYHKKLVFRLFSFADNVLIIMANLKIYKRGLSFQKLIIVRL